LVQNIGLTCNRCWASEPNLARWCNG